MSSTETALTDSSSLYSLMFTHQQSSVSIKNGLNVCGRVIFNQSVEWSTGNNFLYWLHLTERWLKRYVANENVLCRKKRYWKRDLICRLSLKHASPSFIFTACRLALSTWVWPWSCTWQNSIFVHSQCPGWVLTKAGGLLIFVCPWSHFAHPDRWGFKFFFVFSSSPSP